MKPTLHKFRPICALGIVSLFALFLAASQPHRVHHLLENLPAAAGHGDRGDAEINDRQPHHGAGHHHHSAHAQTSPQGHTHEERARDVEASANADDDLRSHPHADEEDAAPLHAHNDRPDANHDGQPKTDCATQSVAKHAHLSPVSAADLTLVFSFIARLSDYGTDISRFLVYLPFSPRAPPQV